jgi:hypothetical protein
MTAPKKRPGALTPAVYRFLSQLVRPGGHGLVRAPGDAEFWFTPSGTTGTRVTNDAVRLGVVTLSAGYIATIDKVKARVLLRQHDLGTLPEGVEIAGDGRVTLRTRLLGRLRRSGAGRGETCRWSIEVDDDAPVAGGATERIAVASASFDDRIQAARALCKHLGMPLPGDESLELTAADMLELLPEQTAEIIVGKLRELGSVAAAANAMNMSRADLQSMIQKHKIMWSPVDGPRGAGIHPHAVRIG